jgi:hypothetical protein
LVRTALRAAARRAAGDRRRAACVACRDNARRDAALRPSRFSALVTARERRVDDLARFFAVVVADCALRFVLDLAEDGGGGSFTLDCRAFESPIAIACLDERAPCLPSRM